MPKQIVKISGDQPDMWLWRKKLRKEKDGRRTRVENIMRNVNKLAGIRV